jgi:hypothetical protein
MPLVQYNFQLDAGSDWQYVVRLRDPNTGNLVGVTAALMDIRNVNGVLALHMDAASSRCTVLADGGSIQLHITPQDSLTYFQWGNYPGSVQAVGYWGIGRAYNYDLFVLYATGVQERIMRGFFHVDPNITRFDGGMVNQELTIGTRGSYQETDQPVAPLPPPPPPVTEPLTLTSVTLEPSFTNANGGLVYLSGTGFVPGYTGVWYNPPWGGNTATNVTPTAIVDTTFDSRGDWLEAPTGPTNVQVYIIDTGNNVIAQSNIIVVDFPA